MEIELSRIWRAAKRFWWMVLICMVAFAIIAMGLRFTQTDVYSSSTSLLVVPEQQNGASIVDSGGSLQTYLTLAKSWPVLEQVNDELGLNFTQEQLEQKISVTVVPGTRIIVITATDNDAETAANLSTAAAGSFESQVNDLTIGRLGDKLTALESESETLTGRIQELDTQIAEINAGDGELSEEQQQQFDELTTERLQLAQTKSDIDNELRNVRGQIGVAQPAVVVIDTAEVANNPESTASMLTVIVGAGVGAIVGGALGLYREFRSTDIRNGAHLESLAGVQMLSEIDRGEAENYGSSTSRLLAAKILGRSRHLDSHTVAIASPRATDASNQLLDALKNRSELQDLTILDSLGILDRGVDVNQMQPGVAALLIVESGKTLENEVLTTIDALEDLDIVLLGSVLVKG